MKCRAFTLIGLAMFCGVANKAETPTRVDIRCRILQKSIIAIPALIDGRGPFDFVLDTGTETSLIDRGLARKLGLSVVDRLTLNTPSGQKTLSRAFLPQVSLGPLSETNVEVLVDTIDSISALDPKLHGVLGQNFLSQFDFLLDYTRGIISFYSGGSGEQPIDGMHIPLVLQHGCPALKAKAVDGTDLLLLLDSGTSALTVFKVGAPGFRSCGRLDCNGTMKTIVAASLVVQGMMSGLSIGDADLHDVPAFFSAQKPGADPVDGMLPTSLFRSVYINNREGYAIINPRLRSKDHATGRWLGLRSPRG
jgi:hypothetical protein